MKTCFLAILAFLCTAVSTRAGEVWASGVSRDTGWYDMNKSDDFVHGGADSDMCWLAAGSNSIAWWQDTSNAITFRPEGLTTAEDIWNMCKESFVNDGGSSYSFWTWYFNGYGISASKLTSAGVHRGNYYAGLVTEEDYLASLRRAWNLDASLDICCCLKAGCLMTLNIFSDKLSHVITLWGVEYDDASGYITKFFVTDSDDAGQGFEDGLFTLNCEIVKQEDDDRMRYHIYTEGKTNAQGAEYYAKEDGVLISWYEVLQASRVPEPAGAIFLLPALAALALRRRRSREGR